MTTIKTIAALLNISSTTVSRVLNGKAKAYRISQRTEKLIKEKAQELKFRPNQIAKNLRLQKTNTIGLVIPDISNPFFAKLARTIELELRKRGKLILLSDTKDDTALEEETLFLLMDRKVDGILLAPVGLTSAHFQHFRHIPMVMVDRYFENTTIPYVATNNFQGAYLATEYLILKGHQNIACIQGLIDTVSNQKRLDGFQMAIETYRSSKEKTSIIGSGFSIENGFDSTVALLKRKEPPTAIFTFNNQIAIGAMLAIKEHDLSIPNDISLISFDEQAYFALTSPPISTIKQPIDQIGKEAVRILFDRMTNKKMEYNLIDPLFIERESVRSI